jgi:ARG and Rhodanese-Phosphatase-superfamily-associated Protein domain
MDSIVTNYLFKLGFGELQTHDNMAVIPLFSSLDHSPRYLTLKEALERRLLLITEISKSGSVPELKVVNKAEIPVLLLDGEELAGAKQNRVLNTTILLKEQSETIIPVSCTEHGRWSYASAQFVDSGNIMNRELRSRKVSSVRRSLEASHSFGGDQGALWEDIACCAEMANVRSATGAMSDIYQSREDDLKGYLDAFKYIPHQKGIFVMLNGRVAGFDVISLESAYEIIHPKLVKSYAMDALLTRSNRHDDEPRSAKRRGSNPLGMDGTTDLRGKEWSVHLSSTKIR